MKNEQQERQDHLRELLGYLESVMSDIRAVEDAATMFPKLLAIDRWLQRDLVALTREHERQLLPEDVVPANYRLHRQDELASEPVIEAEIVGIGCRQGAMTVFATFPGHAELAGQNEFVVGFEDDDQRLETVEFLRVDPTTGAHLDAAPGALVGLYAALIATCRDELDQWRINVAELEDIKLESAESLGQNKSQEDVE